MTTRQISTPSACAATFALTAVLLALSPALCAAGDAGCAPPDDAAPGGSVVVTLSTGDVLHAAYAGCEDGAVLLDHAVLGPLRVPRAQIVESQAADAWQQRVEEAAAIEDAAAVAATPATSPAEPASAWTSQLEIGLNGSSGNAQNYNLRAGAAMKRETESTETVGDLTFIRAEADDDAGGGLEVTESKLLGNLKNDWLFPDSPWRYFVLGSTDVDEFKDYDVRWSLATGPAYTFIDTDLTKLIGRVGVGLSQEVGGDDEEVNPELLLGGDWEQRLSERQTLVVGAVIYPDLSETGEFRSVGKAAWDLQLDPELDLKLRLGLEDRYDSNPGSGTKRNDVDYYASLLLGF